MLINGEQVKQTKKENTHLKIIFGAEVAKVLEYDISVVDKALVFGILLEPSKLDESDIQLCRAQGQVYIDNVIIKPTQ